MDEAIDKALRESGIEALTAMQKESISAIAQNRNVLLEAPTGSGKTLAFILPALERTDPSDPFTRVLIIEPTRELALQTAGTAQKTGLRSGHHVIALIGGMEIHKQENALKHRPTVIAATAGRLLDLLQQKKIDLSHLQMIVIDEADQILSTGQKDDVQKVLAACPHCQRILVSATWNNDLNIFLPEDYVKITSGKENAINDKIALFYTVCAEKKKELVTILSHEPVEKAVVFVKYKQEADELAAYLSSRHILSAPFSSYYDEHVRRRTLAAFEKGEIRILVSTDAASRGLDINGISHVIHYDLPDDEASFIHRSGRTAHQFNSGKAILILNEEEKEAAASLLKGCLPYMIPAGNGNDLSVPLIHSCRSRSDAAVLWISAGRKDKIRPKDIIGALCTIMDFSDLGALEIQDTSSTILIHNLNDERIKQIQDLTIKGKRRKYKVFRQ